MWTQATKLYNDTLAGALPLQKALEVDKLLQQKGFAGKGSFSTDVLKQYFLLTPEEYVKDIKSYIDSSEADGLRKKPDFFDKKEFTPLHVGLLVEDFEGLSVKKATSNKEKSQFLGGYISDLFNPGEDAKAVNEKIFKEFQSETQSLYLENLIIPHKDLTAQYATVDDDAAGGLLLFTSNNINNFPGNIHVHNIGSPSVRKPYGLDTKLKEISTNPNHWYVMLRSYTGIDLSPKEQEKRVLPDVFVTDLRFDDFNPEDPDSFFNSLNADSQATIEAGYSLEYSNYLYEGGYASSIYGSGETLHAAAKYYIPWYNWIRFSPGLRNLLPIIKDRLDAGASQKEPGTDTVHNVALAFMELTVAEATGLEYSRVRKLFPNMQDIFSLSGVKVIFGRDDAIPAQVIKSIDSLREQTKEESEDLDIVVSGPGFTRASDHPGADGLYPHFLLFEKVFRDPSLPFNKEDSEVIDYFSKNNDLVNKELYEALNSIPASMGIAPSAEEQALAIATDIMLIEEDPNFNPNVLKYILPFSEVQTLPGSAGVDISTELTNIFSGVNSSDAQIQSLIDQIEIIKEHKSLINQNIALPTDDLSNLQTNIIKNSSHFIKATHTSLPDDLATPPAIVPDLNRLTDEIYNFSFSRPLDSDIQDLIKEIYPGGDPIGTSISKNYTSVFIDEHIAELEGGGPGPGSKHWTKHSYVKSEFLRLDPSNFKAQIFGQLLTHKFFEKFEQFYDPELAPDGVEYVADNKEEFRKDLNAVLSTYGYSALQYAYSTQMFSKLKHSRLHKRGFMKKIWKKILKTPTTSDIDPRCQQLFDQLGAPSTRALDKTETDFFNLENIKPKILQFYKESLCKDVYEPSFEGDHAAQVSLLQGMVMMIAKVYTLEMCLAAVIAWDSFNLKDAFLDTSLVAVIVKNILQDYPLNFVARHSKDILRKEEKINDMELIFSLAGHSPIDRLIEIELENISRTIQDMFLNNYPLNTDLKMTTLKNSDLDFVADFENYYAGSANIENAIDFATLYTQAGIEYTVDARMEDNIYTMNFGTGIPPGESFFVGGASTLSIRATAASLKSDIYGHFTKKHGNKNYFHSLPQNYYFIKDTVFGAPGNNATTEQDDPSINYQFTGNENSFTNYAKRATPTARLATKPELHDELKEYISIDKVQNAFYSHLFKFENIHEFTVGNELNSRLGNMIFQPYVKIEDYAPDEERPYRSTKIMPISGGEPCDDASVFDVIDINEHLGAIDAIEQRRQHNIFNCEMYDYIPLAAWSYFYNEIFMKKIMDYAPDPNKPELKPLYELYKEYGLDPFFKKVSFGIRMTYVCSYPVSTVDSLDLGKFREAAFGDRTQSARGLKRSKCLFTQRVYNIIDPATKQNHNTTLREIQIPIVETERELEFHTPGYFRMLDKNGEIIFRAGGMANYNIEDLGTWSTNIIEPATNQQSVILAEALKMDGAGLVHSDALKRTFKNFKQFFYNNLSNSMLQETKISPEFRLVFEYLFPMRRYMALPIVMASDGLSKFIPEPTDVLEETKTALRNIINSLLEASDYKYQPDPVANLLSDLAAMRDMGTTGKEPDLTKEILRIILRTPLLILKGFVETTDPAVMIAKAIIDIANTIVFTTLAAIKTAIKIAKQVIETGIRTAEQLKLQLEANLGIGLTMLKSVKMSLGPAADSVTINVEVGDPISTWVEPNLKIEDLPENVASELDEEKLEAWKGFQERFKELEKLVEKYVEADKKLKELIIEKDKLEQEGEQAIKDAERKLKKFFKSPYLLPGMWASMLPSMTPYMGGLVPPGLGGGPPSTIPGMIYIALLLIDAIEEKMHDDLQKIQDDPKCEDQL